MHKTAARLTDGRELIYYDEEEGQARVVDDPRPLEPVRTTSEMRYDPLLDEWVGIAGHRQTRTFLPPANECPLCPSTPERATEVPSPDYDVVVFENRFPSFAGSAVLGDPPAAASAAWSIEPAVGRCEVVCFTSDHSSSFAGLTPERVRLVVDVWADRTVELSQLPYVQQVFCFENRGEAVGVTLHHPHGQIYAFPFITPRTRRMIDSAQRHHEKTGRRLLDDVLAAERQSGERVVARSEHWTAFVPAAARWPVEVHVYANRAVPDIPALDDAERDDFAELYLDLLRRLDRLFDGPLPYMACWHQAPVRAGRDLLRLHLQLFSIQRAPGRLKYLACPESGMGAFVNDIPPEMMTSRLREAGEAGEAGP